jgi:hypothetical protein
MLPQVVGLKGGVILKNDSYLVMVIPPVILATWEAKIWRIAS